MTKEEARRLIDEILEQNLNEFVDMTAYVMAEKIEKQVKNGNKEFKDSFLIGYFPERVDYYDIDNKEEIFNIWQSVFNRPIRVTSLIHCGNKYPLFAWNGDGEVFKKSDFAFQLYDRKSLFGRKAKALEYIISSLPSAVNKKLSEKDISVELKLRAKFFNVITTATLFYSYKIR